MNAVKQVDSNPASLTDAQNPGEKVIVGHNDHLPHDDPCGQSGSRNSDNRAQSANGEEVDWDGPDDPENPQNWTLRRKIALSAVVSCFTFISPVASSMIAPAFDEMNKDLSVSKSAETEMMLSAFVLAYALGPLIYGPLSEVYGRVKVLQTGNVLFLIFNLACAFANTGPQMIVFRLLSGFGGCAPITTGPGLLSDCWKPEQRGRVWGVYTAMPLIGPAVGPIAAAFIAEKTTWRWIFWSTSAFDALVQVLGFWLLSESYAPELLRRKALRLKNQRNQDFSDVSDSSRSAKAVFDRITDALKRPYILLATQPIIQVMGLYGAYLYGMIYLVLGTFPEVWSVEYHESTGVTGLNYISLAVGFMGGELIMGFCNDYVYRLQKDRAQDKQGKPEFRLPILLVPAALLPGGLFWYGWSAQYHLHWIMLNIGAALYAAAVVSAFQIVLTYLVDTYPRYTASAVGATTTVRYIASFLFPLFAPALYRRLGWGWGNSLLAFVGLFVGLPVTMLLGKFGERMRNKSKFARDQD